MSAIAYLILCILYTIISYLWYKYWRKGLRQEYGHDKLGPGDQFMYIKHILGITIGVMGIIIMLIRLIIYGNIYYPSPW